MRRSNAEPGRSLDSVEARGASGEQPWLCRPEVAARLIDVSRSKIFEMLASGELPSLKIGRSRRVPIEALRRWVEEHTGGRV